MAVVVATDVYARSGLRLVAVKRRPLLDYDTFPHPWVTPRELATFIECDPRTIIRMIDGGSVVAFRVGRNWRIPIGEAKRMFPVEQRNHA